MADSTPWGTLWDAISTYRGDVKTKKEIETVKRAFEVHTSLTYVLGRKDAIFGTGAEHRLERKVWFCKDGVVTNNGTPFVIISRLERDCMFGRDKHGAEKRKKKQALREVELQSDHPVPTTRRRKIQMSRKKNCKAKIIVLEVVDFPDFNVLFIY